MSCAGTGRRRPSGAHESHLAKYYEKTGATARGNAVPERGAGVPMVCESLDV